MRVRAVGAYPPLAFVKCRIVLVCVCVCQHVFRTVLLVEFDYANKTDITTRANLYFLSDSCSCTTFDLRKYCNANNALMHNAQCTSKHSLSHICVFLIGDQIPVSAASCELSGLLTFLLS